MNAVIVLTSIEAIADDEQQAEHEEQVIDTEQDVLDPDPQVGRRPLALVLVAAPNVIAGSTGRSRRVSVLPSA